MDLLYGVRKTGENYFGVGGFTSAKFVQSMHNECPSFQPDPEKRVLAGERMKNFHLSAIPCATCSAEPAS